MVKESWILKQKRNIIFLENGHWVIGDISRKKFRGLKSHKKYLENIPLTGWLYNDGTKWNYDDPSIKVYGDHTTIHQWWIQVYFNVSDGKRSKAKHQELQCFDAWENWTWEDPNCWKSCRKPSKRVSLTSISWLQSWQTCNWRFTRSILQRVPCACSSIRSSQPSMI